MPFNVCWHVSTHFRLHAVLLQSTTRFSKFSHTVYVFFRLILQTTAFTIPWRWYHEGSGQIHFLLHPKLFCSNDNWHRYSVFVWVIDKMKWSKKEHVFFSLTWCLCQNTIWQLWCTVWMILKGTMCLMKVNSRGWKCIHGCGSFIMYFLTCKSVTPTDYFLWISAILESRYYIYMTLLNIMAETAESLSPFFASIVSLDEFGNLLKWLFSNNCLNVFDSTTDTHTRTHTHTLFS